MNASDRAALDRHALVVALWLACGLVALALLGHGFGRGGWPSVAGGFGVLLAAFVGHVIVNAVFATTFTRRELALGLVVYAAGLAAFLIASLAVPGFAARHFLVASLGFLALFAGVTFYMITHFGMRQVFDAFNVISDFGREDGRDGGADGRT